MVVYAFCKSEETKAKSKLFILPSVLSYMSNHLVLENTTSGVIVFNDTFQQLSRMSVATSHVTYLMWFIVDSTPLGGVGGSGCKQISRYHIHIYFSPIITCITDGRQVLRHSFDEFSYRRAIVAIPNEYVSLACRVSYQMTHLG